MTILHLGHQPGDLSGITDSNLSTDTNGFDSDLDVNAVKLTGERSDSFAFSVAFAEPAGDLWFQVRFRAPDTGSTNFWDDMSFLAFRDASGDLVAELRGKDNTPDIFARAAGDSTVDAAGGLAKGNATTHWINVRVAVGADITIELYDGSGLMSSATAANAGGKGKPVTATFGNDSMHSVNGTYTWYYAHIAVLDGVSTIGRRFARQVPDAAGTHTDWSGSVSALGDGDLVTRMAASSVGDKQSFTLTGPSGPSGSTISAVHIKTLAQRGATGPDQMAGLVRINGTDYETSAQSVPEDIPGLSILTWTQNPDTNNAWTDATIPSEVGLKADESAP